MLREILILSLLIVGVILWLFGDVNIFAWIGDNWLLFLETFGVYIVVGMLWSLIKWKLLCRKVRDKYYAVLAEFLKENSQKSEVLTSIPEHLSEEWLNTLQNTCWSPWEEWTPRKQIDSIRDIIPKPNDHKSYLLFWLGYWPLSVLWFFLDDVIDKLFHYIYKFLSRIYQPIANSTFADVKDDIKSAAQRDTSDR